MPTAQLFPLEGLDGTVHTPYNLHVFKWKLFDDRKEVDDTGFGDGDEELTSVVSRRYFWSLAAFVNEYNSAPTGTAFNGTVQIELYNGTHNYKGPAKVLQYQEEHDHNTNNVYLLMSGRFYGQPTING